MTDIQQSVMWRSRHDSALRLIARLFVVLGLSLLLNAGQFWAYVQRANETTVRPYFVYYDAQGHVIWQGEPGAYDVPEALILARLQDWVQWVRARPALAATDNQPLVKRAWQRAYDMTTGAAQLTLAEFFKAADPILESNRDKTIDVQILAVGEVQDNQTYQLLWRERVIDAKRRLVNETRWRANLSITREPRRSQTSITVREVQANDLGVWIHAIHWWQELDTADAGGVAR